MNDFTKILTTLKNVHKLNSPEDYNLWYRQLFNKFIVINLGDVIYNSKPYSVVTAENPNTAEIEKFERNREFARVFIDKTICFNAQRIIDGIRDPLEQLKILRNHYCFRGRAVFSSLITALNDSCLINHSSIEAYTEEFRGIDYKIKRLDKNVALPDEYFIERFLIGLSLDYISFRLNFNQRYNFKSDEKNEPSTAANLMISSIATPVVTIRTNTATLAFAIRETQAEERKKLNNKRQQRSTVFQAQAYIARITNSNLRRKPNLSTRQNLVSIPKNGRVTVEIPYCSHCEKPYYTADNCFILHPELKQDRSGRSKRNENKRKRENELVNEIQWKGSKDSNARLTSLQD
ncbi:hypothetical protein MMC10_000745 [Thelotrema lepadinum]|nr:hypothetical protein [Thelotrema lepadinum]